MFVDEDIPKNKKYEVRMTITFDKELTQEEAEKELWTDYGVSV